MKKFERAKVASAAIFALVLVLADSVPAGATEPQCTVECTMECPCPTGTPGAVEDRTARDRASAARRDSAAAKEAAEAAKREVEEARGDTRAALEAARAAAAAAQAAAERPIPPPPAAEVRVTVETREPEGARSRLWLHLPLGIEGGSVFMTGTELTGLLRLRLGLEVAWQAEGSRSWLYGLQVALRGGARMYMPYYDDPATEAREDKSVLARATGGLGLLPTFHWESLALRGGLWLDVWQAREAGGDPGFTTSFEVGLGFSPLKGGIELYFVATIPAYALRASEVDGVGVAILLGWRPEIGRSTWH